MPLICISDNKPLVTVVKSTKDIKDNLLYSMKVNVTKKRNFRISADQKMDFGSQA